MKDTLSPANIAYRSDGTPYSSQYGDVYYSDNGALGQARHVFLNGTGLPQQWSGRRHFTIVETGFGMGLNFLTTWLTWWQDPEACTRLHVVSLEKHPFSADDLRVLLDRLITDETALLAPGGAISPQLTKLVEIADALHRAWPVAAGGLHRLEFEQGKVVLTLGFGDALTLARRLRCRADAFFLDGFSPARNPEMWDVQLFKALARLADEGAPIATYTSAGEVRRNLISAGFAMRRSPGYGSKREMLVGHFVPRWRVRRHAPPQPVVTRNRHALVIGAGLAGCAIVERLASRGWHITLIDRADGPAHGASGNPAGVFHPMITRDEGLAARLSRAGFLYALHRWRTLDTDAHPLAWAASGLFQKDDPDVDIDTESGSESDFVPTQAVANNAMPEADDTNTLAPAAVTGQAGAHDPAPGLPHSMARRLDAEQAAVLCGVAPNSEGWFFEQGGWIDPVSLCQAQLAAAATVTELTCLYGQRVESLNFDNDQWHAIGGNGVTIASADIAIVANAHDVAGIVGLRNVPTESVRGQLTLLPADLFPELATPMITGAYLSPSPKGAMTGASYGIGDTRTEIDPAEHRENLSRLARLLGRNHAFSLDVDRLAGRVGFRCVTRDRMPMIGPLGDENATRERANSLTGAQLPDLPRMDRLFAAFGYGSRGLIWSALGAELLISQIEGEPAPLESDLIDAIDPGRFLLRAVRRGKVS